MQRGNWLIPLALAMFLVFAFGDCRGLPPPDPANVPAVPASGFPAP